MCFHTPNLCWSNTKRFLSLLVCFWKVFCFYKKFQKFKNSGVLFWRLSRGLVQSHAPVESPYRDFSRLTCGSMSQSWKILRIFFKILVFMFLATHCGDLFAGGRFSRKSYTEIFAAYLPTFSRVDLPVAKSTLKNFSKFLF